MGTPPQESEHVQLEASRAAVALNSGVLSSLRKNATAYGFSVAITAAFAIVSTAHPRAVAPWPIVLFAAGAAAAFFVAELTSSRMFTRVTRKEEERVVMISGSMDMLSIIAASVAAIPLAHLPGIIAWPATSMGATLVFLLVSGVDMLIARAIARRGKSQRPLSEMLRNDP